MVSIMQLIADGVERKLTDTIMNHQSQPIKQMESKELKKTIIDRL